MKLALAQYPVSYFEHWEAFEEKLTHWVQDAAATGAELLVFPEYGSMELTSLLPREVQADVRPQLSALQPFHDRYVELYVRLARQYGVYLIAGSFPVQEEAGFLNRAYLLTPAGEVHFQDKLVMTRFENEQWGVDAATTGLKVFDTERGHIGINICYDSEFPPLARAQAEAGADLIVVPSCTDAVTGYYRVQVGSRARALENQVFVAHASLVGEAAWNEAIDVNVGAAGVYGPIDHGFSPTGDGIVVLGELNEPGWVYADLDLQTLRRVREAGQTFNVRDWPHGVRQAQPGARVIRVKEPAPQD
ncbi:carbon-nitrogen hydrolase family protein [Deinococcus aerophilus]|uniref:Amidohydrolase n=1 Tax=Deinococcus aerophilus TaxID=522488 RepID=A0ABQ2H095_9DEIO|nr:carbon-nitrogen hydrolase family protein [Deinococcus aerophilus]GGM20874.1 amidohydrolase [Deinococcus aerophilus]